MSESSLKYSPMYNKSIEIFRLTRHVVDYVSNGKDLSTLDFSRMEADRYASDMVTDSLGLVPKIVETEIQENPKRKLQYAKALRFFIDRLYANCVQLERTKTHGLDFVKMLRKELKSFRKMYMAYLSTLV